MTVKQNLANRGEVKWTRKMYWCDFWLFKVGFNKLINKISFA